MTIAASVPAALDVPRRLALMGMSIDVVTERQAIAHIIQACRASRGGTVITPNLDQLRLYHRDASVRELYPMASLVLADGMPLVWASRIAYGRRRSLPERVPGSGLILSLTAAAAEADVPIYLLGGNPGAADGAAKVLRGKHPGLRIVGTHCPPVGFEKDPAELDAIRCKIAALPDGGICYVGLGFPKQERLIAALAPLFPKVWFLGIGISLSFVAGEVPRAPRMLQKLGLEWMHRLVHEPRRLFKRYVVHDMPFACRLMSHAIATRLRGHKG